MKRILPILLLFLSLAPVKAEEMAAVVHPDHSVTLTLSAPGAKHVKVEGSFAPKKQRMHKVDGQWTLHLDSLPPEIYTYRFWVDKKPLVDTCARVMRDVDVLYNCFTITDSIINYCLPHPEVPRGKLEYVWYYSTLNGMSQRRMAVYLPAQYFAEPEQRFPVLYLLHGSGGDETAWADCGCACQILDNMMSCGLARPCIVVMPNGNADLDAAPGESPWMDKAPAAFNPSSMTGMIEHAFVKEIVRTVDKRYRTLADRHHRAIAGLSLGGLHTMFVSVNNPDVFDYVGLFSAQATNMLDDDGRQMMIRRARRNNYRFRAAWGILFDFHPSLTAFEQELRYVDIYDDFDKKLERMAAAPPRVFYIAIGRDDKLLAFNRRLMQKLDVAQLPYEFHLTDGAHSWENWRRYLIDFLPKIFGQ